MTTMVRQQQQCRQHQRQRQWHTRQVVPTSVGSISVPVSIVKTRATPVLIVLVTNSLGFHMV